MKKLLITTFLFFCFSVLGFAQSSQGECTQKMSEFPALRGLKLNMSRSDVMKIYPLASARKPKDEIGVITMSIIKDQIVDDELKRNLKGIAVELMDDNVKVISVMYDDSVKWVALPKFVESLSGSLNIPVKYWETKADGLYASANCSDFTLVAMLLGDESSLLVQVRGYYEITKQRKKDIEERKNKSFKP
jgi:hypothetical protein